MRAQDTVTLQFQGELLKVKIVAPRTQNSQRPGGSRAAITEFSRKSRKTLLEHFARMDWHNHRATFITLTYHQKNPTASEAKNDLRAFLKRVFRRFGDIPVIWRMERQKRGVWHFHLIAIGMSYYPWNELLNDWRDCAGEQTITNIKIELLNGSKQVRGYVSKYVAKSDVDTNLDTDPNLAVDDLPGRFWGIENRKNIVWAVLVEVSQIGMDGVHTFKRAARRYWAGINRHKYAGFSLFVDNTSRWHDLWVFISTDG